VSKTRRRQTSLEHISSGCRDGAQQFALQLYLLLFSRRMHCVSGRADFAPFCNLARPVRFQCQVHGSNCTRYPSHLETTQTSCICTFIYPCGSAKTMYDLFSTFSVVRQCGLNQLIISQDASYPSAPLFTNIFPHLTRKFDSSMRPSACLLQVTILVVVSKAQSDDGEVVSLPPRPFVLTPTGHWYVTDELRL
jgi:hypothetical protein